MAPFVYIMCTVTSGICAALLLREHRRTASRVLLWCGLAFVGFTISNALVFTDFVLVPATSLALVRAIANWMATTVLVVALVWDLE
jgi:hypothetical protein